ncbi:MAG: hypothetical protein VB934_09195 [Polyangiaceae bacterium]
MIVFAACTADGTGEMQTANIMQQGAEEACSATLSIWQKDAYKETAGRTSALWPPHTTTTITMSCGRTAQGEQEVIQLAEMANHGTMVGAVDANGDHILVETSRSAPVSGDREELIALASSFADCECDGETTFLSMDSLDDESAAALVESLSNYMEANLACDADTDVATLVSLLQEGAMLEALALLEHCSWKDGADIESGLDAALEQLALELQNTLSDYHLCNNDAKLQTELFERFANEGRVTICDKTSPICRGPLWFYDPEL